MKGMHAKAMTKGVYDDCGAMTTAPEMPEKMSLSDRLNKVGVTLASVDEILGAIEGRVRGLEPGNTSDACSPPLNCLDIVATALVDHATDILHRLRRLAGDIGT